MHNKQKDMTKQEKIEGIKKMIKKEFGGSITSFELGTKSPPFISICELPICIAKSVVANKMNVLYLFVETFNEDDVEIVVRNEDEITFYKLSYDELSDIIIDEIYYLLEDKLFVKKLIRKIQQKIYAIWRKTKQHISSFFGG